MTNKALPKTALISVSNKSGVLTGNATVDILQRKVTLKKELIHLRKLKVNEDKQIQLQNQIEEYDNLLKQHRLKK